MSEVRDKLVLTVRFLQPYSHGRGSDGAPEWPPSPLRVFQAMVASAVGKARDATARERAIAAIQWLEGLEPPEIYAVEPQKGDAGRARVARYPTYVPGNVGDIVANAWSAGREASLAKYRNQKDIATLFLPEDAEVSYVYSAKDETALRAHFETLQAAVRTVTHVGWGIDQVVGEASLGVAPSTGTHWRPTRFGTLDLRAPTRGTFDGLEERHQAFVGRVPGDDLLVPVAPLRVFARVRYSTAEAAPRRPFIAFRLMKPSSDARMALEPASRTRDVAAWFRHAVSEAASTWSYGDERELVHGHRGEDAHGGSSDTRFAYLPLPTIAQYSQERQGAPARRQVRRATDIARVLLLAPFGKEVEALWLEQQLLHADLVWKQEAVATLDFLPAHDAVLGEYTGGRRGERTWTTVTPVVLPGRDDGKPAKTERLLRKAFLQAGFAESVVESMDLEWSKTGFLTGVTHADRYLAPDKVSGPHLHVKVRFKEPVLGPIAVGSGRYRGLGTFAVSREASTA